MTTLPVPKLHPRSLGYGNPCAGGVEGKPTPSAPWLHDTCPECGWDGDAAIIRDPDLGPIGWECPDCLTFVTTRDLEDA